MCSSPGRHVLCTLKVTKLQWFSACLLTLRRGVGTAGSVRAAAARVYVQQPPIGHRLHLVRLPGGHSVTRYGAWTAGPPAAPQVILNQMPTNGVLVAQRLQVLVDTVTAVLNLEGDMELMACVGDGDGIMPTAVNQRRDVAVLQSNAHLDGLTAAAELVNGRPGRGRGRHPCFADWPERVTTAVAGVPRLANCSRRAWQCHAGLMLRALAAPAGACAD